VNASAERVSRTESIVTPLAVSRLLEWLDEGVDSQGERYLDMHRRLVSYFDRHDRPVADELADETFRRIAATLEQSGTIDTNSPARYCYTVARSVLLEDFRRKGTQVHVDEPRPAVAARPSSLGSSESLTGGEHHLACLDRRLQELRADERELIVEYYGDARQQTIEHRGRMAARMGISRNALSIRAFRIREALMNRVTSR
jgi:DNA-directed RNA polymerase specialized sigma24 family protein